MSLMSEVPLQLLVHALCKACLKTRVNEKSGLEFRFRNQVQVAVDVQSCNGLWALLHI